MMRGASTLFLLFSALQTASAQQAPDPATLSEQQKLGQRLFYQHCGVCHTKPQITSQQYGPVLSKDSANGDESIMRETISDGTPRMPGFKVLFSPDQINAIVAYLKVVPTPPPQPAPANPQR